MGRMTRSGRDISERTLVRNSNWTRGRFRDGRRGGGGHDGEKMSERSRRDRVRGEEDRKRREGKGFGGDRGREEALVGKKSGAKRVAL